MPPDTTLLPSQQLPSVPWPDTAAQRILDSLKNASRGLLLPGDSPVQEYEPPRYLLPEWQLFLIVFTVILISVLLYIIWPDLKQKQVKRKQIRELLSRSFQLEAWLSRFNPYFRSLAPELKERFLYRTMNFMVSKEFKFHSMKDDEIIKVLISGAAVQLTFGLRNYLMDNFSRIHVIQKEYFIPNDDKISIGHVGRRAVHLSWNHFQRGYEDYSDSDNLGLHEWAHALNFDAFISIEDDHDYKFRERLNEFALEGWPVLRAIRKERSHVLSHYATENFDEFWAVTVETFFENPVELREHYPNLYREMSELLNQDPLTANKILNPMLAGK